MHRFIRSTRPESMRRYFTKCSLLLIALSAAAQIGWSQGIDRHPELKSRAFAWSEFDGSYLVDTTSRAEMLNYFWTVLARPNVDCGWTGSLNPPVAGETSELWRVRCYAQLNAYRALNYSLPIIEDASKLPAAQAGALLMLQNPYMSHFPDATWVGYNELAAKGAKDSEIGGDGYSVEPVLQGPADFFIGDGGANNEAELGHRFDMLHDANTHGAVAKAYVGSTGNCLWTPGRKSGDSDPTRFIAWPAPGYTSANLLHGNSQSLSFIRSFRWSFTLATDDLPQGTYTSAVLTAKINGVVVPVRNLVRNPTGAGITWGFDPQYLDLATVADGTTVDITIENVYAPRTVASDYTDSIARTYHYSVTFFDENKIVPVGHSPTTPLVNLSTRGVIGGGGQLMIAGLSVTGSIPVRVALRTQGPGLAKYGVGNPAQSTHIQLYDSAGKLFGENTGWKQHQDWRLLQSLGVAPSDDKEAGMVVTLWPGNYTAVVTDDSGAIGVAIVEAFNIDNLTTGRLVNLSTRGNVGTGEQELIAGIGLQETRTILVCAKGPTLTEFDVSGTVSDPTLSIVDQATGQVIATNDDWQTDRRNARLKSDLVQQAPHDSREAALILTLPAGTYTAKVSAKAASGVGLVEFYDLGP